MPQLINWEILSNPYNWLMIWAVVGLAVLAVTANEKAKGRV